MSHKIALGILILRHDSATKSLFHDVARHVMRTSISLYFRLRDKHANFTATYLSRETFH